MYSDKIRPYNGDEPYIFISYAHKDNSIVLPIVERMTQDGYRIWYDEGITPGTEWDDEIALHIDKCNSFIAFISNNYLKSENCRDELNFVRDLGKERLLVYIEEVSLPPGMAMRLGRLQDVRLYNYGSDTNRFFEKLYMAGMLKESKGNTLPDNKTFSASEPFQIPGTPTPQPMPGSLFGPAPQPIPGSLFSSLPKPQAVPVKASKKTLAAQNNINKDHITDSRYTLDTQIGYGGMANVYRAFDNETRKIVAIKFFYQYQLSSCPFFTEEAIHNTIKEIKHPNLCKILDADQIADPYLVMEYIDGVTIGDYLKENYLDITLNFKELLQVFHQILEALFLLHRHHIFYGDVSPYNVMLSKTKQASLIDYTECNFIGCKNPNKTLIMHQFMSPEKMNANTLDHRSDIYEAGGLFEKMLQKYANNSHIFHSEDTVDIYDTPVFEIVRKATKKNPDERYQSVLEMLEAIDKIINEYT